MVNILNVNPDVYINCNYQPFLSHFVKNKDLKIGDIIGVIKTNLKKSFIIGPNLNKKQISFFKNKIIITSDIIEHIKNPVLHFKPISSRLLALLTNLSKAGFLSFNLIEIN